ncbi:hypothetical protein J2W88_002976 [Acidovorax delafieldii]|uniref:Uncharacterized protein n=1 Tax=Acidovorax delafieldii TaxID=47920 RepID=A0AAJ2C092_ACIDE|nr:hypothetical protein [Acidovorax delafieldii]MDR6767695.1 hypothetical protein [Acidovorax delafieldii]MDR6839677.1 hypothetical protein [Acidovorax delafieldii]MDR7368422.1 hypothetical protein [Acidovorax delafieldii]
MTYRPNPDSLAGMVLGFLARNPDEELTLDDIVAKFVHPGDSRNVHNQLMAALDHDMLTYDPEGDLYRKGPVSLPSARRLDDGDDGTGEKPGAAVNVAHRAPKVATRTPAPEVPKNQTQQAPDAINTAADTHFEHQGLAPAFDALITKRRPWRRGERNGMDGPRNRAGTPATADSLGEGTEAATARKVGESDQEVGRPTRTEAPSANELAAHRGRADQSGPPDSQGYRHWPAQERLEAGRGDRVGSGERTDAAGHAPDGEEPRPASHLGQPGAIQLAGALGAGNGSEPSAGAAPDLAAEGPDNPGYQQAKQGGSAVDTVRDLLVQTLVDLRDKSNPMDLTRAKTIAEVSTAFVNLAKVQVDYVRVTQQQRGTIFEALPAPGGGT